MTEPKRKILVAMSGGVDSSVTAALLKEAGHEVGGATIRTWASNECADLNTRACCGLTGVEDARKVADQLGIPYWVFNFEKEFKAHVVDYFAAEYMKARTPNPCIACNEHIKFRLFLHRARQLGYDSIATGHYARLERNEARGTFRLAEGADKGKDQSYVLFPLDREVLDHLFLPVGGYAKSEIRDIARRHNLCVMNKPDSQEICFIPSNDYGAFLDREIKSGASAAAPVTSGEGVIRTREGKVLGKHEGYYHYTIGQRRGLGVAFSERLYVVDIFPETNEVVVGTQKDILHQRCAVSRINWFDRPDSREFRAHVKIRSQHTKAPALVTLQDDGGAEVFFEEPQEAITPGQAAVFYDGPAVLGGGWIDSNG
ncbi:MAG TPA: tRNA 2-thiouridine(34) synthase MnmA [Verrucomicrobiae bacterium]|jgi:tRNA-specific 2-thiouridylase|nr:tRNA 2-thiouridine(34) synthase MnmA [Verrucomicrobiae bacterium]